MDRGAKASFCLAVEVSRRLRLPSMDFIFELTSPTSNPSSFFKTSTEDAEEATIAFTCIATSSLSSAFRALNVS